MFSRPFPLDSVCSIFSSLPRSAPCCAAVGNGGKTDKYEWTQVLQELSVVVPVPEGSKSRDVICDITKSRLRVGLKGQPLIVDVSHRPHPVLLINGKCVRGSAAYVAPFFASTKLRLGARSNAVLVDRVDRKGRLLPNVALLFESSKERGNVMS